MRDVNDGLASRMLGEMVGNWWKRRQKHPAAAPGSGNPALAEDRPWHLPAQQIMATNLVFEVAGSLGQTVRLIDVNQPGRDQDLVTRWVGDGGVVPLLVRTDGRRLQGLEEFLPKKVRRFIGSP
jgi:hypothetical protein